MNIALNSDISAVDFNGTDIAAVEYNGVEVWRKASPVPVEPDTWEAKTWTGLKSFSGSYVWTDGENIYHSYYRRSGDSSTKQHQYVLLPHW